MTKSTKSAASAVELFEYAVPAIKSFKTVDGLETAIKSTLKNWHGVKHDIQHILLGIGSVWVITESNSHVERLINLLVTGMGQGVNQNAMRQWAVDNLGMMLNEESELMVMGKMKLKGLDMAAASTGTPWWQLKPVKPSVYSLEAALVSLVQTAQKNAKKVKAGKVKSGDRCEVQGDVLSELLTAIARINIKRPESAKLVLEAAK